MSFKSGFRTFPSLPTLNCKNPSSTFKRKDSTPRHSASFMTVPNSRSTGRGELGFQRRTGTRPAGTAGSLTKSSPGLTAAVERQFGRVSTGSPCRRPRRGSRTVESSPTSNLRTNFGQDGSVILDQSNSPEQVMTSKKMVEMFLHSRRRKAEGSTTGRSDGSSPAVFL